jgi:hypothetical protein
MEQKVLDSIQLAAELGSQIAAKFGHTTAAGAIAEYASLAPVFAGIFDSIHGLFKHSAANPVPAIAK